MRTAAGLLLACGVLVFGALLATAAVPPADSDVRVSPSTVRQGQSATVYGEGFCPPPKCSQVSVFLDGRRVASATATKQGTFALTFRPDVSPGGYRVMAVQNTPQGSRRASTGMVVKSAPATTTTTTTHPAATTTTTTRPPPTTTTDPPVSGTSTTSTSFGATLPREGAEPTTSSVVLPAAGAPGNPSSGYVSLIWWLVPSAVGALIVIGMIAWRQRPTGEHDSRML